MKKDKLYASLIIGAGYSIIINYNTQLGLGLMLVGVGNIVLQGLNKK